PTVEQIADSPLASSTCDGPCKVWDFSLTTQAESNFALLETFQHEGVSYWWLDWWSDNSTVSMPGLTPDSWIGHLFAQEMVNQGERGFVLERIGADNTSPDEVFPAGPWSAHTAAVAFTGDAWGTWDSLAEEVALTPDEATIGEPYVSDDIGSYLGPPPQGTDDPPDLYDRWVQFGTFQPILRLHSFNENRLPWEYPQPVRAITTDFLILREELVPYTYTLAAQAHFEGMPMTRPLYLQYPNLNAAYSHPGEYMYGSEMLVAPVTSPGDPASTTIWFPPGRWVDYFTGATIVGPTTLTLSVPLSRMPVFVRAGGIVPEEVSSDRSSSAATRRMVLKVFPGANGSFDLYEDSGSGLGYTKGQYTHTLITDSYERSATPVTTLTIGAAHGSYPHEPRAVAYRVELSDLTKPSRVMLDGRLLPRRADGSLKVGWSFDAATDTVVITSMPLPTSTTSTILVTGSYRVNRSEPA
ncbi:MAG: TIM-barrel domain-containing protein, partial [Nitrososphaerales archaeon]